MIGSFWNLCRACPSMPIDKLHSEYRSTYTWHEYTGTHQENTIVRRAPQAQQLAQPSAKLQTAKCTEDESSEGPTLEPPLPRRKKCPQLAYRTHAFTPANGGGLDVGDSSSVVDKVKDTSSQLSRAISRISTEYRLQFAWPRRQQLTNGDIGPIIGSNTIPPRKSISMGQIKQASGLSGLAPVHKRRIADVDEKRDVVQASELEPLVVGQANDAVHSTVPEGDETDGEVTELKINFRVKKPGGRAVRIIEQPKSRKTQERPFSAAEVMELRRELKRLAEEYKHRDWGSGMASADDSTLWKQVSNNHSLNALSLARTVSKEEKELVNSRKISPFNPGKVVPAGRPSSVQVRPNNELVKEDLKADIDRATALARRDFLIRHHLDRTTGTGDGALLPSPTREKLEPVMPRRRDDLKEHKDDSRELKTKLSPKSSPRTGRSQSVGPSARDRKSPKRQTRPSSTAKEAKIEKEKENETSEKVSESERYPRPIIAEPQINGYVDGKQIVSQNQHHYHHHQGQLQHQQHWREDEPIVKSPPEPTRVKSPEQMIMRSPEPVNWTVPLDTGKTFTVTQNVREGELLTRPHSEAKNWGSSTTHEQIQNKFHIPSQLSGYKSPESESVSLGSFVGGNGMKEQDDSERESPLPTNIHGIPLGAKNKMDHLHTAIVQNEKIRLPLEPSLKIVPGSNLRCLEDPVFKYEQTEKELFSTTTSTSIPPSTTEIRLPEAYRVFESSEPSKSGTIDVLETARNRFDKFWGKGSE